MASAAAKLSEHEHVVAVVICCFKSVSEAFWYHASSLDLLPSFHVL